MRSVYVTKPSFNKQTNKQTNRNSAHTSITTNKHTDIPLTLLAAILASHAKLLAAIAIEANVAHALRETATTRQLEGAASIRGVELTKDTRHNNRLNLSEDGERTEITCENHRREANRTKNHVTEMKLIFHQFQNVQPMIRALFSKSQEKESEKQRDE